MTTRVDYQGFVFEVLKSKEHEVELIHASKAKGLISIPTAVEYEGQKYIVVEIGQASFYECEGLTSVTIPESIKRIGTAAFSGCEDLTSVTIPNSVKEIGKSAFYRCTGLKTVTIPDSVTEMGDSAFAKCENLTSVILSNSLTELGDNVFSECSSLTSVTIPNSVTTIYEKAFSECTNLKTVTIPDSVTKIDYRAFRGCSSLNLVTIPNSVTVIEKYAFEKCKQLENVIIVNEKDNVKCDASAFPENTTITYLDKKTEAATHIPEPKETLTFEQQAPKVQGEDNSTITAAIFAALNKASENEYQQNITQSFIGVKLNDKPCNFFTVVNNKKGIKLSIKVEQSVKFHNILNSISEKEVKYNNGWYIINLQSTEHISSILPILLQAESQFLKK